MTPRPGDIVLAHNHGVIPSMIRFFERAKLYGWIAAWRGIGRRPKDLAFYNHAAIVSHTDAAGTWVIQAEAGGVNWGQLVQLENYLVVDSGLDDRGRALALAFAKRAIGSKYGFFTIASIAINIATPRIIDVSRPGTFICSALVAQAMLAGGYPLPIKTDLDQVSPAELGQIWKVAA